ncbi:MFS transporter [Spirosoma montaniterrae]|uniref:MFS transporter permease n=1 Tax=Spirosoma montaniterrae TaxID=1178516 RepID=A0A1P9WUL6_9BACT|nr:MFS transporter [Spirosoma montaniterrae]AQG79086.1 MFS transporter permease [Spirosoma montaniterrae]
MKNNPRILSAWAFYDWANSVHALVIVSSIFPVYFSATALNEAGGPVIRFLGFQIKNSVLFSYTISAAFLFTALLSPICTAIADYSGRKKAFMKAFCYLGAVSCSLLVFFTRDTTTVAVICFWLSLIGWSGSIVFYNSYLPDIATEDQFDRVSARGYSMGYVGSVLLMILNLVVILKREWFGNISEGLASRLAFLTVGLWWAGFAQIPFNRLPNPVRPATTPGPPADGRLRYLLNGFRELRQVWAEVKQQTLIRRFLVSFFVYSMGVQTVMYVATIFGSDELKMSGSSLIVLVLLLQLVAIPGAYGFSRLSERVGNTYALMVAVVIWIGICAGAYAIRTESQFFVLAGVVGLVMGGIQSLSRSTYAKLIPATHDTASYFSFYDVTEKLSIVFGTLAYGLIEQLTGSMRNSVLALLGFFVVGFLLLWRIPSQKIYATRLQTEGIV